MKLTDAQDVVDLTGMSAEQSLNALSAARPFLLQKQRCSASDSLAMSTQKRSLQALCSRLIDGNLFEVMPTHICCLRVFAKGSRYFKSRIR
jgi:hypothetical protein